jgi:glycosyltransferase involved in cell wall biosynthesis
MGGAENLTISIIKNDKYFQHIVIVLQGETAYQKYCEENFNINFLNFNLKTNSFFSLSSWKVIISNLRKIQPDIIQSYMYDASKFGRIAGFLLKIPVFIYIVNTYSYKKIRRGFFNYFLSFFTYKIIVNSNDVKNDVIKIDKVSTKKIFLLESFANLNFKRNNNFSLRKKFKIKKTDYLFLFVARLVEQKGIEYLIDAVNICVNQNKLKKLKLVIVGDGELRSYLITKIINYKLAEHIYLVGEDPNLDPYLTDADAYIDSSIRSGLSVAAIKALEASLPTIMTDVGGVSKLSDNGKYVKICPPANSEAISSAITDFYGSKKKSNVGAPEYVKSHFSDISMTKKIVTLYKEALKI